MNKKDETGELTREHLTNLAIQRNNIHQNIASHAYLLAPGALHGRQWQSQATSLRLHALYLLHMPRSSPFQRQTTPPHRFLTSEVKQVSPLHLNFPCTYQACRLKQARHVQPQTPGLTKSTSFRSKCCRASHLCFLRFRRGFFQFPQNLKLFDGLAPEFI